MDSSEMREKVLQENKKQHNLYACLHDSVCSYIARRERFQFYSAMICRLLELDRRRLDECRVLEIGCGTGTWTPLFRRAKEYVGIDLSDEMIKIATSKYSTQNISFKVADVKSYLADQSNTFDLMVSSSFLHHLYDIDEIVLLASDSLNKGGCYLALHEPIQSLNPLSACQPIGACFNSHLTYLAGYDCDLKSHPWPTRVARLIKSLIPFKTQIKKAIGRTTEQGGGNSLDYVDFRLSQDSPFHPAIFANKIYPDLEVSFDMYSYYTFSALHRIFGDMNNYFYVKFEKQ